MSELDQSLVVGDAQAVTGVVLSGGRGRRMGGVDKGLLKLEGQPMIEWVLERLAPQVSRILINANRSHEQYAVFGYPIVTDVMSDFRGPLAGIAAVLANIETPWAVTVPCDSPLIASDLVPRLKDQVLKRGVRAGVAHDGQRLQPVFMFLHRDLLVDLDLYLERGERKIDRWLERHSFESVDFSDSPEMFLNANTPTELEAVSTYVKG